MSLRLIVDTTISIQHKSPAKTPNYDKGNTQVQYCLYLVSDWLNTSRFYFENTRPKANC